MLAMALMLALLLTATPAEAQTPGNGDYDADEDGLIEISNLAQLNAIRYDPDGDGTADDRTDSSAYIHAFPVATDGMGCPDAGCAGYELVADLDFDTNGNGRADAGDAWWNDGAGWLPIDSEHSNLLFNANFDGGNHTIANLYINRDYENRDQVLYELGGYVGLFGRIASPNLTIQRIGLTSVSVTCSGPCTTGGLAGAVTGSTITDSYVTGTVTGGTYNTGGLVGWNNGGTITASYATGNVSACENIDTTDRYITCPIGGLVGQNGGTIIASHATGSVSGGEMVGGLVGHNVGTIIASHATGSVSGIYGYVGGLVGNNYGGTVTASYATSSVSGDGGSDRGGLVGYNRNGTITASYATGSNPSGGGLVGLYTSGTITASYWDTETSSQTTEVDVPGRASLAGEGKATAELQAPTGYTGIYADWNVDLDNADGDDDPTTGGDDPWDFGASSHYPELKYVMPAVTASAGNPDRAALIALYNATDGPNWTNIPDNESWLVDDPNSSIGEWHGVTTDANGRVTELLLWNKGLNGTIPSELGNLTNLTDLRLGGNRLGGTIPSELGQLVNLTVLNLGENQLTGNIPDGLGNLVNLEVLSLDNDLTGLIPAWLGDLSRLRQLNLGYNRLTGPIPPELAKMTELQLLYLSSNDLTGTIPAWLGSLTNLQWLTLDNNNLSGPIPAELSNLSKLQWLVLGGTNQLGSCLPPTLQNLDLTLDDLHTLGLPPCNDLGNASRLSATPGGNAGEVVLRWTPGAANATAHVISFQKEGEDWKIWPPTLADEAGRATITGLEAGQSYSFLVVSVRETAGTVEWSSPSNVAQATAGSGQSTSAATDRAAPTSILKPAGSKDGTNDNDRLTDDSGLLPDSAGDAVITTASVLRACLQTF